jgi:phospholipid transport system substrate-binding protein
MVMLPMLANAMQKPDQVIESTVQTLIDEFTSQRSEFEADKRKLFAMVDRVAVPLFDFERISKLVLAKYWKKASTGQRQAFSDEFRKLLIGTYATALFQYTGNETVVFTGSKITERKGRKFAVVSSEVSLGNGGPPIPVDYSMLLNGDDQWKIYNLTIDGLNMITSYRSTYGSAITSEGLDGLIDSMKAVNAKNY